MNNVKYLLLLTFAISVVNSRREVFEISVSRSSNSVYDVDVDENVVPEDTWDSFKVCDFNLFLKELSVQICCKLYFNLYNFLVIIVKD